MQFEGTSEEIYFIELNHWSAGDGYPAEEPFFTWMSDSNLDTYFRNEEFVMNNKICVRWFIIDMSIDFLITAPKSFIDKFCPELWKSENKKFIQSAKKLTELPYSWLYGEYEEFLPFTEEYIGKIVAGEWY